METKKDRWQRWRHAAGLVGLLLVALAAPRLAAAQQPVAPAVTNGNYTVTYPACGDCAADWLEERREGGSWAYVGWGSVTMTNKPAGTYYYRIGYAYVTDPVFWYTAVGYSGETRVTVSTSVPTADPLTTQLGYGYEARYGDANGDGRRDLFVNRVSGGSPNNGALETVLLLQDSGSRFATLVPSAAQTNAARSWPLAGVQIVLRDFNVDGFVDVLLRGVAGALGNAAAQNQIVYSSASSATTAPRGIRAVDASLKSFVSSTRDYLSDPGYFSRNAPIAPVMVPVSYYDCVPGYSIDWYSTSCSWFTYYMWLAIPDYSVFDPNALKAWTEETAIQENRTSQAQGVDNIGRAFESAIGAPIGGRNLDGVAAEQGSLDSTRRRGLELFLAILGISDANAQELTPARESGRRADVVYVTGRRILGFLPFHTALEYAGQTISAYDNNDSFLDDGALVSQVNWPSDHPSMMMTMGTVASSLGSALYWTRLIAADARYRDNLVYDAVPNVGDAGYNSNGYVNGIVRATGGTPSIDLTRFVGGEKPVPPQVFN